MSIIERERILRLVMRNYLEDRLVSGRRVGTAVEMICLTVCLCQCGNAWDEVWSRVAGLSQRVFSEVVAQKCGQELGSIVRSDTIVYCMQCFGRYLASVE